MHYHYSRWFHTASEGLQGNLGRASWLANTQDPPESYLGYLEGSYEHSTGALTTQSTRQKIPRGKPGFETRTLGTSERGPQGLALGGGESPSPEAFKQRLHSHPWVGGHPGLRLSGSWSQDIPPPLPTPLHQVKMEPNQLGPTAKAHRWPPFFPSLLRGEKSPPHTIEHNTAFHSGHFSA